ncbi:3D-(3,5/4)-trihydroxycyclohexane-1,2-dione acylhydrolase (decyclizing) [Amycolatopsis roodepoortensis]|uniref:3D-(3,5/4)-trihydroxycyclohexane-1,2-dione acylhydrolase (Decyclizing) n=1 Tax=Amycolatopsis roodepoortensis TaxID=700274 RepID=A0ABR9L3G8_9PSEU|nr:3D-(3,5/4)-trihydroxycyclohexane-1,2-dione acylhydrolase (decyclizing) [Amycolatopsis roodepoortensis]MBE1575106.1 3D-(3,5/4)-trihydroxycyclohexane-1,2-dione acylhydrolase (decyclizing) [Amycolatopsis roodepoortensis]
MKLTTAQALVRWLLAQRSETLDGREVSLFPGVFAIFGHGNVLGLGTALEEHRDELPVWRGQTEQGMALAAVGYAKATHRRQVGVVTSSIGPGALNMVTAAGVAHANRLPVLLLPGDTFTSRAPDPVLQQVEHFGDPTATVNDAFRAVSRYFDRITRPEQLLSTLPQVARVLTDPADAGPVTLALPQDVQAETYDFPDALFAPVTHRPQRPRPDRRALTEAAGLLRAARKPLLVLGGGVRYSGAGARALAFAERHGIPVTETTAGRTLVPHGHPLHAGPLGVTGSTSANVLAAESDVVLAVGTRLQDFTTASWTVFSPDVRLITLNAARFDAVKHGALAVVGDADAGLVDLSAQLENWQVDPLWTERASAERARWDAHIDTLRAASGEVPTYAQIVGAVNDLSGPNDYVMTASGGMPGELIGGWRGSGSIGMDVEYGFSCMGYELAGAWGAAMAHTEGLVTTMLGDGSYLMLNSELFSAAFAGHPFVAVVCDNDGYAVIARLQEGQGGKPFNNFLGDCRSAHTAPPRVDFARHAESLGCAVFTGSTVDDVRAAYAKAREAAVAEHRPAVVVVRTRPDAWTEAGAWWEVGVPEHLSGRADFEENKAGQVRYLTN